MRSRPYAPCVRKLGTSWQTHRQEHHPDAPQDDEKTRAQPLDGVLLANERMRSAARQLRARAARLRADDGRRGVRQRKRGSGGRGAQRRNRVELPLRQGYLLVQVGAAEAQRERQGRSACVNEPCARSRSDADAAPTATSVAWPCHATHAPVDAGPTITL